MTTADETKLTHAGLAERGGAPGPVNPPVVRTSTVVYPDLASMRATKRGRETGERYFSYGRRGTPTAFALEDALAELEQGHRATLHPSGLAAIAHVLLTFLKPGDHLIVTDAVYAPVRSLCEEFLAPRGIAHDYVAGDPEAMAARLRPETRMIYTEIPGSLTYEILDLPALAALARERGVLLAVDNTWGAGLLYKPLPLGADISIQALTKYVVGHSDVVMGAVVAGERAWQPLWRASTLLGQCVSPDDAYLALRGMRSMAARLAMHEAHARAVAWWLQGHPLVAEVLYPALPAHPGHAVWKRDFAGANGLVTVALRDGIGPEQVDRFVDGLRLFAIGSSWGGFESLVLPVETKGHAGNRHAGPLVRLHVGLEHPDDLVADLDQALSNAVQGPATR